MPTCCYLLNREFVVAVVNGLLMAGFVAAAAALVFQDALLGGVIAIAMVVNLIMAAVAGSLLPSMLTSLRIDPAIAGGVVLTTITDVTGFFRFPRARDLGLRLIHLPALDRYDPFNCRHRHPADEHRRAADVAAYVHIVAHADDVAEHVLQIGRDGDFVHRKGDLAVFDPESSGPSGVVSGHAVDPLTHQVGYQQTGAEFSRQTRQPVPCGRSP